MKYLNIFLITCVLMLLAAIGLFIFLPVLEAQPINETDPHSIHRNNSRPPTAQIDFPKGLSCPAGESIAFGTRSNPAYRHRIRAGATGPQYPGTLGMVGAYAEGTETNGGGVSLSGGECHVATCLQGGDIMMNGGGSTSGDGGNVRIWGGQSEEGASGWINLWGRELRLDTPLIGKSNSGSARDVRILAGGAGKSVKVQHLTPTVTPAYATNPNDLFVEGVIEAAKAAYIRDPNVTPNTYAAFDANRKLISATPAMPTPGPWITPIAPLAFTPGTNNLGSQPTPIPYITPGAHLVFTPSTYNLHVTTGTSGDVIPLLSGANTWSATQTMQKIKPAASGTYDLGEIELKWRRLFLADTYLFEDFLGMRELMFDSVGVASGCSAGLMPTVANGVYVLGFSSVISPSSSCGRYGNAAWPVSKNGYMEWNVQLSRLTAPLQNWQIRFGFGPQTKSTTSNRGMLFKWDSSSDTYWNCITGDTDSSEVDTTTVAPDTNWHRFGIRLSPSRIDYYIDGTSVCDCTNTSHIDTANMAPYGIVNPVGTPVGSYMYIDRIVGWEDAP